MVQQANQGQNLEQMLRSPKRFHIIITKSLVMIDVTNLSNLITRINLLTKL